MRVDQVGIIQHREAHYQMHLTLLYNSRRNTFMQIETTWRQMHYAQDLALPLLILITHSVLKTLKQLWGSNSHLALASVNKTDFFAKSMSSSFVITSPELADWFCSWQVNWASSVGRAADCQTRSCWFEPCLLAGKISLRQTKVGHCVWKSLVPHLWFSW